ncbi:amino acid/polyamine/organocation transporter (APC superfamily) [Anseongella ginsenosidimutans]|uniref:Amino acid/polyamine/organocation transporter (APC superfamily) n=1 Tax=Anseongella ginsenosidimutans TaxID=496056 RepID=A0A4R3KME5_9SPHI|nr:amino acid permease [Anseongella ginsenosidimutans]QEC52725.1 amino acid permease [Anseongella ginsenosidimutans]TCS85475.1 amino acid/polyamine/organocation transporter (APC superfamily) [Anseongella ginsenosidimutans]
MFYKKPLQVLLAESEAEGGLKRTLTARNLVALGIGAIIGAGIFTLTGTAAATNAGPAVMLSFLLAAFACVFAGLCYSEFASMIPIAGSAYTYAYATMGEFIAWIIGWDLILEYLFAASTVAVSWSGYVVSFFRDIGIHLPSNIASAPYDYNSATGELTSTGGLINFPAMFIVAIVTTLLVVGIRESTKFNNIIVLIKVTIILLFIGFGIAYIDTDNLTPFIPENEGPGLYGWSGVLRGASIIFFAYIGFDAVSTAAQEAKNPQKDMPKGILGSLAVCTLLYILVSLVMTGVVSYEALNVPDPVAVAVNAAGPDLFWLRFPVKIGAIAGLSSVILVMLMGQPRIFYAMAHDGLLPAVFSKIHPKFRTPYISTISTGLVAILIAGFAPINLLGELVSIGTLLAFMIVCGGILVLRYTNPELPRPFKAPLFPFTPIMGILVCGFLMVSLPWHTWERLLIWMAIGILIYFLYSKRHSKIGKLARLAGKDEKLK